MNNDSKKTTEERPYWPFDMPKRKMVLTCQQIIDGKEAVHYVSHDGDDDVWQFHPHEDVDTGEEFVRLSPIIHLFTQDTTLATIADLPPGWHASRATPDGEWEREPIQ